MGIGLFRLSRYESLDPLFDLGNVFWFLQALWVNIPGFGELPAEEVDHVQDEMGSRVSVCAGGGIADPGQGSLLRLIPLALQQHRFTLGLVVNHRSRSSGLPGEGVFDVRRGGLNAIPEHGKAGRKFLFHQPGYSPVRPVAFYTGTESR